MRRLIEKELLAWKNSKNRKPLLLKGTRQVGKTWSLKKFGKEHYPKTHYLNFQESNQLRNLFKDGYDIKKAISDLENYLHDSIDTQKDFLIFDEIQDHPRALTSLKYFYENLPELSICGAGSHLGVTLSNASFPVGKVNSLSMYPLNFQEYLLNKEKRIYDTMMEGAKDKKLTAMAHEHLWEELKTYFICGGMPEIVQYYLDTRGDLHTPFQIIRKMQKELIENYRADFAKHSGKTNANHINGVYNNIPYQIQKVHEASIQRYRFKDVLPNLKKYAQFAGPIDWLVHAGLAIKVKQANNAAIPLEAYCKENVFKLYYFDTGLLGAHINLPIEAILNQDYGTYKGFFAENFVAQELQTLFPNELCSWAKNSSEIEFVIPHGASLIPIEVKSGSRVKAKSLQSYKTRYNPDICVKLSALNFNIKDGFYNCPIYMAGQIKMLLMDD